MVDFCKKTAGALLAMTAAAASALAATDNVALAQAKDILVKMTLEEKIALCVGSTKAEIPAFPRIGIDQAWRFADSSGLPVGGTSAEAGGEGATNGFVRLPGFPALASTWNVAFAESYGDLAGEQARSNGLHAIVGPGANILVHPFVGDNRNWISEDPVLSARFLAPAVRAMQNRDVSAFVKSFGASFGQDDIMAVGERALNEIHLPPFMAAVKEAGAHAIVADRRVRTGFGRAENVYLVRGILRERWGFEGMIIPEEPVEDGGSKVLEAVKAGEVPESFVDGKALRVLYTMARTHFFDGGEEAEKVPAAKRPAPVQRHAVALKIAEEAITLLKNDLSALPLNQKTIRRILVVGDGGGIEGTMAEFLKGSGADIATERRDISALDAAALDDLRHRAEQSDAVLVFVGDPGAEDVAILLDWVLPNIVFVNCSDGAVEIPWARDCFTLVHVPELGDVRNLALVRILFGEVNPSGRLPFTWPKSRTDLAQAAAAASAAAATNATASAGAAAPAMRAPAAKETPEKLASRDNDIYVGYRRHDRDKTAPLFPFGHGLGYTQFDVDVDRAEVVTFSGGTGWSVSVPVKNTGRVPGKETVQIYAAYPGSRVERCAKELKGFAKTRLLAPGESETLSVSIAPRDLAYWDPFSGRFRVDAGDYAVLIGESAMNILGKAKITVPKDYVFAD